MANYFEVRIKRTYVDENNTYKTVKEAYLIAAETYTEAETGMAKFMVRHHSGDSYTVLKIQASKITMLHAQSVEPIDDEGTMPEMFYFKAKCIVLVEIEGRKKPKRVPMIGLIKAVGPEEAVAEVAPMMEETDNNYELVRVEKTKFVGVVIFNKK